MNVPTSAEPIIAAEHRRRLVDRPHRLHDPEHRRDDAERGQRIGEAGQRGVRPLHLVMVRLDRVIHHLLDRMDVERSRRHDDEAQRVGDQVDERVVLQQLGIFGEHGG